MCSDNVVKLVPFKATGKISEKKNVLPSPKRNESFLKQNHVEKDLFEINQKPHISRTDGKEGNET